MYRLLLALYVTAAASLASPAAAMDKRTKDFVAANLIAIYYHEFGHALIDILKLPIYGQEEDAADVLSAVLIHDLFEEEAAQRIARATAVGFLGEQSIAEAARAQVSYWDVHGPDLQRYYSFVCLIFGANPDIRRTMARQLRLPSERMKSCPEEYSLASSSWGPVIDTLVAAGGGQTIRFLADHHTGDLGDLTIEVIGGEVAAMNRDLSLPKRLLVRVEACETVNAFYDPKRREIIMCTEFAEYLAEVAPK